MNTLITAIGSFSASAIGTYPKLIDTIKWAAKTEGLILDPTYTEKAFHALKMYANNGIIKPNSNVVFWHTGGLLNLMATHQI
jgi:1-aminocyclopropane-1-carboxylate deaminase/D-cysteine desulfhydrase-like pyridoxal-dependent ACC family enzyme